MELLTSIGWILLENSLSILAVIIAYLAYRQSKAANTIAEEANQLVKLEMAYSQGKNKQEIINNIITRVVDNWTKIGGAKAVLISEWHIHNKNGLTLDDFNKIWEIACLRVKQRAPKQTFQEILEEVEKNSR